MTAHALRVETCIEDQSISGFELVRGKHVHFMGICGIGVSGLARLVKAAGATVSGCDKKLTSSAGALISEGIAVRSGHSPEHLAGVDILVHTSAVRDMEPEVLAAQSLGIPIEGRLPMLLRIAEGKRLLGVAGSHGKTTTTALASALLIEAGLDPWCAVGGEVDILGSNARAGKGDWFVAELDESDGYIADASCELAVLTNVDRDHLDHYKDFESICRAFGGFLANTSQRGCIVACADSPAALALARASGRRVRTYGLGEEAEFRAVDLELGGESSRFSLRTPDVTIKDLHLGLVGIHNIQNAVAIAAIALELAISEDVLRRTLERGVRVRRRLERRVLPRGVLAIVDYAHHPAKVAATVAAVRLSRPGRVIAVFQPHRYSRTLHLGAEFGPAFAGVVPRHLGAWEGPHRGVDDLIVLPVYAASEDPISGVSGELVARAARSNGVPSARYVESREDAVRELVGILRQGDTLLILGAGDVDSLVEDLQAAL